VEPGLKLLAVLLPPHHQQSVDTLAFPRGESNAWQVVRKSK
jgi:hypothetical protein